MVYLYYARNLIITELIYKQNMLFRILRSSIILLPQIFLWRALFKGHSKVLGIDLRQMLVYILISTLVGIFTSVFGSNELESKMKSGNIAIDISKPTNPILILLSKNVANNLFRFLFEGLPVVIFGAIIIKIVPVPENFRIIIFFILSLIGALLINFLLEIIIGTLSFWFINIQLMDWIRYFLTILLSGAIIPIWFLPEWMKRVAELLPFQAIRFLPVAIYSGKYTLYEIMYSFVIQIIWIVILFLSQSFLWSRGLKRIEIMGG